MPCLLIGHGLIPFSTLKSAKKLTFPLFYYWIISSGHFEAFTRENVTVHFLPHNVTSWKQPCDLGIIAALKKRYKFSDLKDVIAFYESQEHQTLLAEEG